MHIARLALLTMFLLTVILCQRAHFSPAAQGAEPLTGHLERRDKVVRFKRPGGDLPLLPSALKALGIAESSKAHILPLRASDFVFNFNACSPRAAEDPAALAGEATDSPALDSEAESADLIIAWEAWHKRVSEAIYSNWLCHSSLPGQATCTMTFTCDRHVSVKVENVDLPSGVGLLLAARGNYGREQALEEVFARQVEDTVAALNNSPILAFPPGSRRTEVVEHTSFKYGIDEGGGGYTWRKGDVERIHLK